MRGYVRPSICRSARHTRWNHAKVPFLTKTTISTSENASYVFWKHSWYRTKCSVLKYRGELLQFDHVINRDENILKIFIAILVYDPHYPFFWNIEVDIFDLIMASLKWTHSMETMIMCIMVMVILIYGPKYWVLIASLTFTGTLSSNNHTCILVVLIWREIPFWPKCRRNRCLEQDSHFLRCISMVIDFFNRAFQ